MTEEKVEDAKSKDGTELPQINFMTFVMSLNASAMVNLGIIEDPATQKKRKKSYFGGNRPSIFWPCWRKRQKGI